MLVGFVLLLLRFADDFRSAFLSERQSITSHIVSLLVCLFCYQRAELLPLSPAPLLRLQVQILFLSCACSLSVRRVPVASRIRNNPLHPSGTHPASEVVRHPRLTGLP